ncbi:MAG: PEP-CTERM sorting domain-containing protein [Phycisphaerales bacterium]|nr:PEP-CTERM sorting domain-containing protein [Phycisphaerales bacterium]MCB9836835.1 PEP-CTERM sorting domain-containing protein [Phycisphaera sp.]
MKKTTMIAALLVTAGTTQAQFYEVPMGRIDGISNVGTASGSNFDNVQYFAWTPTGGAVGIGGVTPGNGVGGQGKISNDGRYISGTTFNAAQGYHEMSRYDTTTGTWTGFGLLPTIGAQVDSEVSSGWAISGDGQHVVGLGWTSQGTADAHASQWSEGVGFFSLGTNQVGESSRANGVNNDGSVVAGWQDGSGRQGAVWVNGVEELIVTNTGGVAQEAYEVSGDGRYAVGIGIGSFFGTGNAYRYDIDNDIYEPLPNLATGAQRFMGAAAVNNDGTLIGGGTWGTGPATFGNGFIWEEGVGTMTVSAYLDSKGIAYPTGFSFAFVSSISDDGQWLAGWGGPGGAQSWVVHVPAPSSLALLGLGSVAMIRRRR